MEKLAKRIIEKNDTIIKQILEHPYDGCYRDVNYLLEINEKVEAGKDQKHWPVWEDMADTINPDFGFIEYSVGEYARFDEKSGMYQIKDIDDGIIASFHASSFVKVLEAKGFKYFDIDRLSRQGKWGLDLTLCSIPEANYSYDQPLNFEDTYHTYGGHNLDFDNRGGYQGLSIDGQLVIKEEVPSSFDGGCEPDARKWAHNYSTHFDDSDVARMRKFIAGHEAAARRLIGWLLETDSSMDYEEFVKRIEVLERL